MRLRIEDLDRSRARAEYVEAIFEDLHWLGVAWQEPVVYQSARGEAYRSALSEFERQGLTYPCFCTRGQIAAELARAGEAPQGPEGPLYPGTCRRLSATERQDRLSRGEPFAIRLDAARASERIGALQFIEEGAGPHGEHGTIDVQPLRLGDIVLARKDLPAAYHLAVVIDDALQAITLVTRAQDLFGATHVQCVLQRLLDLPTPRYAHHRLMLDEQGRKLSKREGAESLRSLRAQGVTPAEIRARLQGGGSRDT